jgi:hypothetical protein
MGHRRGAYRLWAGGNDGRRPIGLRRNNGRLALKWISGSGIEHGLN